MYAAHTMLLLSAEIYRTHLQESSEEPEPVDGMLRGLFRVNHSDKHTKARLEEWTDGRENE